MTVSPKISRSPSLEAEVIVEPRDPEVPSMEDFTVIKMLGQGGFGIVQLVRCHSFILRQKFQLPEFMAMKKVYMGNYITQQ
jgi:hypothetical protein